MVSPSNEARIILALQALKNDQTLSLRAAAKIYKVSPATLMRRRAGKPARRDTTPNLRRLTDSEEEAIVQYILGLIARAFPPRLRGVEDMANRLLRERDAPPVGKLWAHNFVKRKEKIRTRWSRRYDYQRAKCEDPKVIGEWFALVQNVKAKYGIVDDDIYKANEALSKRRIAKKTRVQLGGSLAVQDAKDQLDQKAVDGEAAQEKEQNGSAARGGRTRVRCCGVCGKPGHNARTCQEAAEGSDSAVSNVIIVGS
jgi:hypothetical protein